MFCANCGKEIADGTSFCGYCGNAVAQPQTAEPNSNGIEAKKNKKPLAKKTKNIIKAAVAMTAIGALLAAALYMTVGGGAEQVALEAQGKQKVTVEFDGDYVSDAGVQPIIRIRKLDSSGNLESSKVHLMTSSSESLVLDKGTYEIRISSTPFAEDGKLFTYADGGDICDVDNARDHAQTINGSGTVKFTLTKNPDFDGVKAASELFNLATVTYYAEHGKLQPLTDSDGVMSNDPYEKAVSLLSKNSSMKETLDSLPAVFGEDSRAGIVKTLEDMLESEDQKNESN